MGLTKKFIVGSSLVTFLGLGSWAFSDKDVRSYLYEKFDKYGWTAIGSAAGIYLAETKPVRRVVEEVERSIGRAACGYRDLNYN